MHLAHSLRQDRVVVPEFFYHVGWLNVFSIIVHDALKTRDWPDRAKGRAANLPRAFSDSIRHGDNFVTLVIEHQMIVAEMRPRHVPMKVLCLEIQRERV